MLPASSILHNHIYCLKSRTTSFHKTDVTWKNQTKRAKSLMTFPANETIFENQWTNGFINKWTNAIVSELQAKLTMSQLPIPITQGILLDMLGG